MFDLRLNYPLIGEEAALIEHCIHSMPSNELEQRLLLPSWSGALQDRVLAAQWLGLSGEESISICMSAHHALIALAFAAELRGATIVTEDYTYPGFKAIADLFEIGLLPCETDAYGLVPDALKALCAQHSARALYIQPTIHNPLGILMPLQRRQEIADLAQRYGLFIIEDDAYRFLAKDAPARFYDLVPQQTAFIMSLTKPVSPALKIAYLLAPPQLAPALATAIRLTSSGASALLSGVASKLIHEGLIDQLIRRKRQEAAVRQIAAKQILVDLSLQSHSTSYHIWLRLPEGLQAPQLERALRKHDVAIVSGEEFAVEQHKGSQYIRIALGGEAEQLRLEQGIRLLKEAL
ncbi:PLP-dependent aminotransferase family protein [Ktedonosporobacter rubrisoli]|nr:PLP-dependent aminotransferase family protein [Ktedonosporobacter rubrisoli]